MYADTVTRSRKTAIDETNRRRFIQNAFNEENDITPESVVKAVRDTIGIAEEDEDPTMRRLGSKDRRKPKEKLTADEKDKLTAQLTSEMKAAAKRLDFETAAALRDRIAEINRAD